MKGTKNILLSLLICTMTGIQVMYAQPHKHTKATDIQAETATDSSMSVEQEQQFLYYFYEAQRLIQAQQLDKAWELVQFCHELNPNDAAVNYYMGCFYEALHQESDAVAYFQRSYELEPDEYWYRYVLMLLQKDEKSAKKLGIQVLESVAYRNPKNGDVREMLQKAYILEGSYQKALSLQDQIDSINGYSALSALQRYRLNAMMGNVKQALAEVERFLEIEPDNYQFQVFRMQLYEQTRQPASKMIAAYSAVLRLSPHNWVIMNNLAWNLCISGGDLGYAEQLSRATIMQEPSNPIFLDTYAWILYHQGDYESAWFYIQRALENSDSNTEKEIRTHYKAIKRKQKE